MGKTRGMGTGRCRPIGLPRPRRSLFRPLSVGERCLQRKRLAALRRTKNTLGSQVSLPIKSDKSLKRTDQTTLVSGTDIQGKLSSDVVDSTSKPQTSSSSLVGMKKTLGSQASLLRCSACMQIIHSDKSLKGSSDQDQTTLVSLIDIQDQTTLVSLIDIQDQTTLVSGIGIQEKSSSDVVDSTSKPQTSSSSLVGMKKTLGSQASLLRCSACMQIIHSDKSLKGSSDQDQTTLVSLIDIQDQTTLVSGIDIQVI
ncbi:PREDICTED: uncharacterized protein LOC106321293 isoform X3 [Brassica oleracea var. oleracea]|uniref:uncharacterized protein LOC106321293 isoform X3 n=1 Tax=Brassica oleracea var. oleracea TaxID=109376 RepID=UPI0006A7192A|nr:PREDICTED: uncharacterized protein LOC106321293 isoform X3 [Brassica oleracea var. oleracea]